MNTKKKMKLKKSVVFKCLALTTILISILVIILFIQLDVLPLKFFALLILVLILLDGFLYFLLSCKNYKARMLGTVLSLLFTIIYLIAINYQSITLNFLHQITFLNIQTETYQVLTLNKSDFSSLDEFNYKTVGYVNMGKGISKCLKEIEQTTKPNLKTFNDTSSLVQALLNEEVDGIIIEKSEVSLYQDMINDFKNIKVIASFTEEVAEENKKEVSITKEPFSMYITGVDTYDKINSIARSDVNIVVTVNPLTHRILLTNIPRDYYVQIDGTTGLKDKITHAGLKGVDTSIKTIETLLDLDINYYAKFNFMALIELVDAVGGIDVDSPFAFTADYQEKEHVYYEFTQGINHLNGKQALAYVRERYSLREGDIARARHQQQVISELITKCTTKVILTNYSNILGSMNGNFITNLDIKNLKSFISKELSDPSKWTIETQILKGSSSSEHTAAFPNLYSSVMIPDEDSITESIRKINELTD